MKPQNILIFRNTAPATYELEGSTWQDGERFVAKLCDFGLSINTSVTKTEDAPKYLGTPRWRAPEVLNQDNVRIYPKDFHLCDIYSLGLVIWSIFATNGRPVLTDAQEPSSIQFHEIAASLARARWRSLSFNRQLTMMLSRTLVMKAQERDKMAWKWLLQNHERSRSSTREYQE